MLTVEDMDRMSDESKWVNEPHMGFFRTWKNDDTKNELYDLILDSANKVGMDYDALAYWCDSETGRQCAAAWSLNEEYEQYLPESLLYICPFCDMRLRDSINVLIDHRKTNGDCDRRMALKTR